MVVVEGGSVVVSQLTFEFVVEGENFFRFVLAVGFGVDVEGAFGCGVVVAGDVVVEGEVAVDGEGVGWRKVVGGGAGSGEVSVEGVVEGVVEL